MPGGLDPKTGLFIQDFWRENSSLHINEKEILAAVATVQSLAKKGEKIRLNVDNMVAYSYLTKWGGRLPHLNGIVKPLLYWCQQHQVQLEVNWVPSAEMLADPLSRWEKDKGDYTLNQKIFQQVLEHFSAQICPQVDMFASPGNAKLEKFVPRWPHFQAWRVDALKCPLHDFRGGLCQPPLEDHPPLVASSAGKSPRGMPPGCPPLGFHFMVAPINQNVKARKQGPINFPEGGPFHQLPGGEDAPQVGPGLLHCLRSVLEQQKMPPADIETYLAKCPSISRYNTSFRKLYGILLQGGSPPPRQQWRRWRQAC